MDVIENMLANYIEYLDSERCAVSLQRPECIASVSGSESIFQRLSTLLRLRQIGNTPKIQ